MPGAGGVKPDSELSDTSENAVQNKVIAGKIAELESKAAGLLAEITSLKAEAGNKATKSELDAHANTRGKMNPESGGNSGEYGHVTFGSTNNWTIAKNPAIALHAQEKNPNVAGSMANEIAGKAGVSKVNEFTKLNIFYALLRAYGSFNPNDYNLDTGGVTVMSNSVNSVPTIGFHDAQRMTGRVLMLGKNDRFITQDYSGVQHTIAYKDEIPATADITESVIAQISEQYELVRKSDI